MTGSQPVAGGVGRVQIELLLAAKNKFFVGTFPLVYDMCPESSKQYDQDQTK